MLTAGRPTLTTNEALALAIPQLTPRDRRFAAAATDDDLALLNELLRLEDDCRRDEIAALEHLLMLCQFEEGALDERLRALPLRAFASAALDLYVLGWAYEPTPS
jgi:hypothetical protein